MSFGSQHSFDEIIDSFHVRIGVYPTGLIEENKCLRNDGTFHEFCWLEIDLASGATNMTQYCQTLPLDGKHCVIICPKAFSVEARQKLYAIAQNAGMIPVAHFSFRTDERFLFQGYFPNFP